MTEPLIRLEGVVKRFPPGRGGPPGPAALDGISAVVAGRGVTGLVGPDGAGKTTLIRLMTGLMAPDAGRVTVLGHDTRQDPAAIQAAIGYMPQRFGLYEDLTVRENLDLYADLRGLDRALRPATYGELLTFTGLAPFTGRLAGRLSGGMKQKLGLACALIRQPRLLLLDEPGVGVDPLSRRDLWAMVRALAARGTGVLWSTAYLDEAAACDHVLLLNQGRLLFTGPPGGLTGGVAGRVCRLPGLGARRRALLADLLDRRDVVDGVIQGDAVRLVLTLGSVAPAGATAALPRFEDAFVDLLRGGRPGPGGRSALAAALPARPLDDPRPVIEVKALTKRFGDFTAADAISFSVPRGQIFGLLGPNGAGKSTTFKMLCGLLKPSAGEGRVAGHDLRRDGAGARARLGYMAQKFSLYGDLSVRQNLDFFAGVYGLRGAGRRDRVALLAGIFALAPHLGQSARELPPGLKQRLALACAVLHEPEVLFLDEPTSGADPLARREFWTHINALVEKGVTVLVTTHFMDEAEYCDRIALIDRGRILALGTPDELKRRATALRPAAPDGEDGEDGDMGGGMGMEEAFVTLIRAAGAAEGGAVGAGAS